MVRRTLALLAAVIAVAAVGAAPADAGGPTSVLLSAPPRVAAVGYDDRAYEELQRLTQVAGSKPAVGDERHDSGAFVRAAWMIHDMSVWRLDIIYPDVEGGPWIATTETLDGKTMPAQPTWHTSTDPAALLKLLGSLKLLPSQQEQPGSYGGPTSMDWNLQSAPGPATEPIPSTAPAAPPQAQTASTGVLTGWRWIIPGVLIGALVAVFAIRLLPKRRDWQLVDAE
jgi:hypothetical protein